MTDPGPARRWHEFDPLRTIILAMAAGVAVAILAEADLRRQLAAIPEPSRSTPQYVLDAAEERDDVFPVPDHFRTPDRPETPRCPHVPRRDDDPERTDPDSP